MDWVADLQYAVRLLRKTPAFSLVAVATLALGIGANSVVFSMVDAVIIRALPYADPDRVVMVWEDASTAGFPKNTPAPGNFAEWRRLNRAFADLAATRGASASLTGDGQPEQILGRAVTANFFSVLGVQPAIGRAFTDDENRAAAPVIVISHGLWQRRYGADRSVLGRTVLLNDNRYEIIGVMPAPFVFRNREIDYWIPVHFSPAQSADRGSHYLNVVGRLRNGVTLDAARADMASVARRIQEQFHDRRPVDAVIEPVTDDVLGTTRLELLVLMAASVAVLLIACANLASLLLSRATVRRGELAVRTALGATRGRIVRQLMVEGLLLAVGGGLMGLALVPAGRNLLTTLTPSGVLPPADGSVNPRLLAFTFLSAVGAGFVFSLAPAVQAASASLGDALREQARSTAGAGNRLTRNALVVVQIAAAVMLLGATGLMIRTLANLHAIDVGFRTDRLLTMHTTLPVPKYGDPAKRAAFFERVVAGVKALPGVERAAYASNPPFTARGNTTWFGIDGMTISPDRLTDALFRSGTTDYLATLDVRLLHGRLIDDRDGAGAPRVVVINETLARQFFANESPLGHRLQFSRTSSPFYTIVGVVTDVRERGYEPAMKPGVYLSIAQAPEIWAIPEFLVIRTRGSAADLAESARRVITSVDPAEPVAAVRTMDDILDLEVGDRRQQMILLGAFAALALVLASLGLYGLLAYLVAQRSREIGLRVALGATPREVVALIAARGVRLTGIGLLLGVAGGSAATRGMTSMLYGVRGGDPVTFGVVVALLGGVAIVACIVPAIRAARVDPMVVLRRE